MAAVVRNPKAKSKSLPRKGKGKNTKPRPRTKAAPAKKSLARSKSSSRPAAQQRPPLARKARVQPGGPAPKGKANAKATAPRNSAAPAVKLAAPPPAGPPNGKKKSVARRKAQRTAADLVAGMSLHRLSHLAATDWEDLMAMADMDGVRPYAMKGQFHRGEVIQHKAFGLGIVVREIGTEKIQVSFRDGVRLLVCNRQR